MLKVIKYSILLLLAFYAVRTYASYSISKKYLSCLEGERIKGASKAELAAVWTRATKCVDSKANFLDRIWFNRDESLAKLK